MKVIYKNIEVDVNENSTVYESFKDAIKEKGNILACYVNNEVKSLNYKLKENDEIDLIDLASRDGGRIYTRGLLFIMAMAFKISISLFLLPIFVFSLFDSLSLCIL